MKKLLMRSATAMFVVTASAWLYGCCCCGGPSIPGTLVQNYRAEAPPETVVAKGEALKY
jgi:hypothetical protein